MSPDPFNAPLKFCSMMLGKRNDVNSTSVSSEILGYIDANGSSPFTTQSSKLLIMVENIRRISEVSKLFVEAGLIVLVSFISPFRREREMAREQLEDGEFVEIFVDTPLSLCEERDPKGLYQKARAGEIVNFTGIDSPYEPPLQPDIHLETADLSVDAAASEIIAYLRERRII